MEKHNIGRLIVIGIPYGGTTWFATKVLNKHHSIDMHNELLFGWTTSYCNGHTMFNDATRCNWNTMKSIMNTFFVDKMYHYYKRQTKTKTNNGFNIYVGFKITLWQIMPTMYGDFVRWVYCNNVSIIQLIRSASINSFYAKQAQAFEILFYGRDFFKTQYHTKNVIKNESFSLDPKYAKKFVETTEFWQNTLTKLFKFHTKSIHFIIMYYEDLISKYNVKYLNALQGFLNVKYDPNLYENQYYGIARLHPIPCHLKINNWQNEVKPALLDTQSYYACEKDNS